MTHHELSMRFSTSAFLARMARRAAAEERHAQITQAAAEAKRRRAETFERDTPWIKRKPRK
jgi:hypothetical protein